MDCISYRAGYKYQLKEDYVVDITIKPAESIDTGYITLTLEGSLTIKKGYAWDGPSGPTIDTLNFMRGALVHDVLYQLMRERHLDKEKDRPAADKLLRSMCRKDGMSWIRACWVYHAVRMFGDPAADPANDKPVISAPKKG
jgi:hypothetical protein